MIRWVQGWFRQAPAPRADEQLADLIEATPPGGCITLYRDEDLTVARWIVRARQWERERARARVMRCGIDWPGCYP